MFQESQYEELDIMPPQQRINLLTSYKSKSRLYLCWRNSTGIECKMIGPQTKCFCNHRFKQHQYLNPKIKKPHCKAPKCRCKCFDYIPTHGAYDFKCLCKHSYKEHNCLNKICINSGCKNCHGFTSAWTCSCGAKFVEHQTIIQTYEERKVKGTTLNDMLRMNQQLNSTSQEGSLMKPIHMKGDRQDMARKKRDSGSLGLIMNQNSHYRHNAMNAKRQLPNIETDEIEEYRLQRFNFQLKK